MFYFTFFRTISLFQSDSVRVRNLFKKEECSNKIIFVFSVDVTYAVLNIVTLFVSYCVVEMQKMD